MGVKGRQKRLRERAEREREALAAGGGGDHSDDSDASGFDDGGQGPFGSSGGAPKGMKRCEAADEADQDYLDRVRGEHAARRDIVAAKRRRLEKRLEKRTATLAAANAAPEDADGGGAGSRGGRRGGDAAQPFAGVADEASVLAAPGLERALADPLAAAAAMTAAGARFDHPLLGLDAGVVAALQAEGFRRMSPIQQRAIPLALLGYDALGQAKTGSGKTLAFCVPLLHSTVRAVRAQPRLFVALLLAPTKELCVQIHRVLQGLCKGLPNAALAPYSVQLVTGGTDVAGERRRLPNANAVVGTPGRVLDHVRHATSGSGTSGSGSGGWNVKTLSFLVLDEADRMLAAGFSKTLDGILAALPERRQTLLFSATNSKSVRELARLSLTRRPLLISTKGDAPVVIQSGGAAASGLTALGGDVAPRYVSLEGDDDRDEEDDDNDENDDDDEQMEEYDEGDNEDGIEEEEEEEGGEGRDAAPAEDEAIPSKLRQLCQLVPLADRLRALYVFVKQLVRQRSKAMVFCSTVASATFHCMMMGSVGFHDEVLMLHGKMKHRQRVATFDEFVRRDSGVLFCTDVAARGLDIPNVDWILQFDPPVDPTEYVHRIGRTARAGQVGSALLFLTPHEAPFVSYLARFGLRLERYVPAAPLPKIQLKLEHVLEIDEVVARNAVAAMRAYVGAYQSHILKTTFDVHLIDMQDAAQSFALKNPPTVVLPSLTSSAEEKKADYVKGKLRSLNAQQRRTAELYDREKTKPQWDSGGSFVGMKTPARKI